MQHQVITAYGQSSAAIRTPKDAEYDVIAKVTQKLITCSANKEKDFNSFIDAVYRNELLWSTLADDVGKKENKLPEELKQKLIYLYKFTSEHSQKVRTGQADTKILIEINKEILRGLKNEGAPK